MEKKQKKPVKKIKPRLIIVSSSTSSSKRVKTLKKPVSPKKNKSLKKPKKINKAPILLVEATPSPSENEKIDLKISEEFEVPRTMESKKEQRLNEKFIDMLEKLSKIMLSRGEVHRARAYQKAQETIMAFPDTITDPKQLQGKPGIGSTIMEKMNEFVETGTLKILEREKENPVNIFAEIYGVGPKKAKDLVDKGIKSIVELREKQTELNDIQRVGLKYYEDILQRIPRSEIVDYDKIFSEVFSSVKNVDAALEIVGSYRRGAESSGDIDVIITSTDSKVFRAFVDKLIERKLILEVLSRGPTKCLVITKLPGSKYARRVDFLYTGPEEYPFSVLYFTGSKIFNTVMRHQAQMMGYSMNEHGMYKMEGKKKGEKIDHVFKSEKDIFDFLNMQFKEPVERVDGRSVVLKGAPATTITAPIQNEEEVTPGPFELKEEATKIVKSKKTKPTLIIEEENVVIVPKPKSLKKRATTKKTNEADTKKNRLEIIEDESSVVDLIQDFKKNGISVLEPLTENQLSRMLNVANVAYRNMEPIMTDNEYDIIQDYVEAKFPTNQITKQIGAPVEKNKATLPYEMASMDKIKPDSGALAAWMQKYKGPYVLSCKLDGVSGLYTTEGTIPKLYTRGDGKVGQDISHLIPYLRLPKKKGIVIRGEFILPKAVFESKYKSQFANPRNLVSGIVNRLSIDEKAKDLNFVAYEVIKPEMKPSEQMDFLKTLDVDIVMNKVVKTLTNEMLSELLVDWRKNYTYEIDGVIVSDDIIVQRKSGNPDHSFAFKMVLSDQIAEAKVVDVLWSPSKDGYLKPRVQIEPINLGGVKIEYATGFNGAFIEQKKIGIGAMIQLIRSGDVIPYIKDVTMPAENPKMPSVPYKWNETHVDIMLEDITQDLTVKEKNLTAFFRGIGVDGLSGGNISRIMDTGNDTIPKIIHMTKADFLKVEGFKDKLATKIYEGIKDKLDSASLLTIMSASNIFGRGISEKKIEPILEAFPDILTSGESAEQKVKKVMSVKGMAKKTAELFVSNIPAFLDFMKECGLNQLLEKVEQKADVDETHPLYKKSIVMTGFRDESLGEALKSVGAKLGSSVSSKTFAVLVKDKEEDTGKANEARKLDIPLYTAEEFKSKYFNQ
jgi:NAD-dependent DNA ligase/DNA polymerase/3'-5' exonuclease PolX